MGKWTELADRTKADGTPVYPALPGDPTRQDALNAALDALKSKSVAELSELYNAADDRKKQIEKDEKTVNFDLEVLTRALNDKLKEDDIESVVTNGYRYTPKPEPYAQVTDKATFLEWAHAEMRDNLNLPWQTLNAVVKAALESGAELPPGVDVYIKRGIHRTKQKA